MNTAQSLLILGYLRHDERRLIFVHSGIPIRRDDWFTHAVRVRRELIQIIDEVKPWLIIAMKEAVMVLVQRISLLSLF